MLELKKGIEILSEVGCVKSSEEAKKIFDAALDAENRRKINRIKNAEALMKIANAIAMCGPDRVFIVDDSPKDIAECRRMSLEGGEETPLAMKDHTIHSAKIVPNPLNLGSLDVPKTWPLLPLRSCLQ